MTPELKVKWLAALRSGEWKQIKGRLETSEGNCCLGVLCRLVEPELSPSDWLSQAFGAADQEDGGQEELHEEALSFLGLSNHLHEFCVYKNDGNGADFLGLTFYQIADWLEKEL